MESLFFLVPAVLVFLAIAIRVLYWALNNGQYDNLNTEAHRILFDADETAKSSDSPVKSSDSAVKSSAEDSLPTAPIDTKEPR